MIAVPCIFSLSSATFSSMNFWLLNIGFHLEA
jgi:hypothetical protein